MKRPLYLFISFPKTLKNDILSEEQKGSIYSKRQLQVEPFVISKTAPFPLLSLRSYIYSISYLQLIYVIS